MPIFVLRRGGTSTYQHLEKCVPVPSSIDIDFTTIGGKDPVTMPDSDYPDYLFEQAVRLLRGRCVPAHELCVLVEDKDTNDSDEADGS